MQEVTLSKEKGVKEKWLTLVQALNHWGKEELWARVQAGTILARKNPLDTVQGFAAGWPDKDLSHT